MFMFRFKMFGYLTAGEPSNDYKNPLNFPYMLEKFQTNIIQPIYYFDLQL